MRSMNDINCLILTVKNPQQPSSSRSSSYLLQIALWYQILSISKKKNKFKKVVYFGFCAEKAENNWPRRYGVPQKPPGALFGRNCKNRGVQKSANFSGDPLAPPARGTSSANLTLARHRNSTKTTKWTTWT